MSDEFANAEVSFVSPDPKNPGSFTLRDLFKVTPLPDDPDSDVVVEFADTELEVYLEWHEGTYGSRIPHVYIRRKAASE